MENINKENREQVTAMEAKRKELGMSVDEFYAIPADPPSESKLPIFDAAHVRNAMARFNQLKGVSAEEKATAKKKIIAAAKKFDIDTSNFEDENKSFTNPVETRFFPAELRVDAEKGIVYGRSIVFNSESRDMGFKEVIKPEAATQDFLEKQDITMLYNHDENSSYGVLARYSPNRERNSLHFNTDDRGVNFDFKVKDRNKGIIEDIQNGDLKSCSFSFRCSDGGDKWEARDDGYLRTISSFDLVKDFSIVVEPAYTDTMVNTRGLDELKQNKELEDQLAKEAEERKAREWNEYYNRIVKEYLGEI